MVLSAAQKRAAFEIEKDIAKSGLSNIGVLSCLLRNITLAFSHNSGFRPPPIPFPEICGKNVCSSSPSPALDDWLRRMVKVEEGDATLLLGFD